MTGDSINPALLALASRVKDLLEMKAQAEVTHEVRHSMIHLAVPYKGVTAAVHFFEYRVRPWLRAEQRRKSGRKLTHWRPLYDDASVALRDHELVVRRELRDDVADMMEADYSAEAKLRRSNGHMNHAAGITAQRYGLDIRIVFLVGRSKAWELIK